MILLYALSRSLPPNTLATSTNNSSLFDPVTGECIDINGCRTTTGILWSCLSVILICTRVAIHPDIQRVGTHSVVVLYKNIQLMVIAILAPEIMILRAMRQWYSAKKIAEEYKGYGWGMSHGFFVIMGGFTLYDGDKFEGYLWNNTEDTTREREKEIREHIQKVKVLSPQQNALMSNLANTALLEKDTPGSFECLLEHLIKNGYITITKDEIKDKSHADFIAKSIALIQTTWFILQVAARAAEGLAVTELEIITVGFALLNFGTYFLWWHKPLRVRYPVRVTWRQQEWPTSQSSPSEDSWMDSFQEGIAAIRNYIFEGSNECLMFGSLGLTDHGPFRTFVDSTHYCVIARDHLAAGRRNPSFLSSFPSVVLSPN